MFQKKARFLGPVVRNVKRGHFVKAVSSSMQYFKVWSKLFTDFSRYGHRFEGKSWSRVKSILSEHTPVQIEVKSNPVGHEPTERFRTC